MADFLPTGGVIAIGTILAMTFLVRRLIPARASVGQSASSVAEAITSTYQLEERSWELEVLPHAPVAGKTLHESRIGTRFGLAVVATWRNGDTTFNPDPAVRLYNGDHLLVIGRRDRVEQLLEEGFRLSRRAFQNWTDAVAGDFVEVVLPPRSNAIGRSLQDLRFRDRYGLTAIALWRGGRSYRTDVGTMTLDIGDALLMIGTPQRVDQLARDPDFLIATSETANQPRHADRMIAAILITLAAILLSVFDVLPSPIAMLLGAAAMVITGCLDMDAAYRSVEWRVLFLIIGFLPLSTALLSTGITSQVSNLLAGWFGPLGSLGFAGGSFLFAMLVTQLIGGQVAALLVGPVVVALASQSGIDPRAIAVAAAIGCSAAFLTPIAHPVNLLMMGPGGYRPQDFLRFGLPIALLTFALLLIGMMLFWGLRLSL
jgi:di/tricarboxylate transporter